MNKLSLDYISKEESEKLLESITNIKHKLIVLLMLDCGLRVSETVSLQLKNFNFKERLLTIRSLKKRAKKDNRTIPMSDRLYQTIGEYLNKYKLSLKPTTFLFPSYGSSGHIRRESVWKIIKRISQNINLESVHPHALRHSFATHHLASGTSLEEIKDMLGHSSYDTTLIYTKIPTEKLKERIHQVTRKEPTLWEKLERRLFPKTKPKMINVDVSESYFTVGRNEELQQLSENTEKGINTVVVGAIGTGKSHLLENIETTKKILRLDDTESIKKSLVQILLYLYKDKETVLSYLWEEFTIDEIKKKVQRENTIHLCDAIIASVKPKEYILIIDDITRVTPTAKKTIERLANAFVIIAGARAVKANDISFIWDFEILKLNPLNRKFSIQLIQQLSSGLEVENWELFKNHIYEQTNGNPRAITELIQRYRKEPVLTNQKIREIKHVGALQEIDMTFIIVLFLGIITAMRYMSRELDEPALRFIGSIGLILLIVSRPLLRRLSKRFI